MGDKTAIQWTEATWNPIIAHDAVNGNRRGWHCEIITPGCERCYAQSINKRVGTQQSYLKTSRPNVNVSLHEETLTQPLRWKRPQQIFVCSMSDLFGEWVTEEMIDRVFAIMAITPQHTYQVLTKRADRMRAYVSSPTNGVALSFIWPLANVWLGVSVEDQRRADERIPVLLDTPAAVRWISAEPLLDTVSFYDALNSRKLHWVVVGGESGHGARPFNIEWARSVIAQCKAARVPCFVKQLGSYPYRGGGLRSSMPPSINRIRLRNRNGGDPSEWPEDLMVREYPAALAGKQEHIQGAKAQ